jgi:hypothetical protein
MLKKKKKRKTKKKKKEKKIQGQSHGYALFASLVKGSRLFYRI